MTRMLSIVVVAALFSSLLHGAPAAVEAPKVPEHVVLQPTFMSGYDSFSAGSAFICTVPDMEGLFLLTAHHLFGKGGGLTEEYDWQEAPRTFVTVTAVSIADPARYVTSSRPLTLVGARSLDQRGYHLDLAGYRVAAAEKLSSLRLSKSAAKVGDTVFLHARQHEMKRVEMLRAIVRRSGETEFEYVCEVKEMTLPGTSGAPVLNAAGEVVAMNIGGRVEDGKHVGIGNPCTSIARLLKTAR